MQEYNTNIVKLRPSKLEYFLMLFLGGVIISYVFPDESESWFNIILSSLLIAVLFVIFVYSDDDDDDDDDEY